jgi:NAD(P)-dependent dehydrogenase (short-subunit alcohol dehydrogenase family)
MEAHILQRRNARVVDGADVVRCETSHCGYARRRQTTNGAHHQGKWREAIFVQIDITQAAAVEALISKAVETYGRLDCAHNNAGISGAVIGGEQRTLTAAYPEERWHQVSAINLTGVWLCMKYKIAQMLQ